MPRIEPKRRERSPPPAIMRNHASDELAGNLLIRLDYPLPVGMGFVKGAKHNACP